MMYYSPSLSLPLFPNHDILINPTLLIALSLSPPLLSQPTALIVDIQETDSSNIISVSTYYENCTPVQLINLLTDATILFRQDTR